MPEEFAIKDRSILVTGGTGSFGQRFVRVVLEQHQPRELIVFSRDEWKQSEMAEALPPTAFPALRFVLGDVRDLQRLETAMRHVEIVVHAAALKQVPAGEANPSEFVQTNIGGTHNVALAAGRAGVQRVIGLSTDKAVHPVGTYGVTKLAADKILLAANQTDGTRTARPGETKFSIVRYGNVLCSRGSVVPYFLKLIGAGVASLPITDPEMTRFWITRERSIQVVLDALAAMRGGEIFIPKIGSMRVAEVARALAPELPHRLVGMRAGEKLHEELLTEEEARETREFESMFVVRPPSTCSQSGCQRHGQPVASGFRLTSSAETNRLDCEAFLKLLAEDGLSRQGATSPAGESRGERRL